MILFFPISPLFEKQNYCMLYRISPHSKRHVNLDRKIYEGILMGTYEGIHMNSYLDSGAKSISQDELGNDKEIHKEIRNDKGIPKASHVSSKIKTYDLPLMRSYMISCAKSSYLKSHTISYIKFPYCKSFPCHIIFLC